MRSKDVWGAIPPNIPMLGDAQLFLAVKNVVVGIIMMAIALYKKVMVR